MLVAAGGRLCAAPPASLLPEHVRFYVGVADAQQLADRWHSTQLGRLLDDPRMEPFAGELARFSSAFWRRTEERLGVSLGQLQAVATGPLALAVAEPARGQGELIILADVSGNTQAAQQLLRRVGQRMAQRRLQGREIAVAGGKLIAWDVPPRASQSRRQTVWFFSDQGVLGVTASVTTAADILRRAAGQTLPSLADTAAFQQIMRWCAEKNGRLRPDIQWYVDLTGCVRLWAHTMGVSSEPDPETFLHKHGFDAIQGIGGLVAVHRDEFDVVHYTAVYAPGPVQRALRMLRLPAGIDFSTPNWAADGLSTFSTVYIDLAEMFQQYGPLFDDLVAYGSEGTFDEIVADIKTETGVDLRRDLIAHLQPRVRVMSDLVGTRNARCAYLVDLEIRPGGEDRVATALRRLLEDDPDIRKQQLAGWSHPLWQLDEQAAMVAGSHLLLATSATLLRRVLDRPQRLLADQPDYRRVEQDLRKLGGPQGSVQIFARLQREVHETYRLLRSGQNGRNTTPYGRLLARTLELARQLAGTRAEIDFTKLPDFERVARYFGLAGLYGKTQSNGWLFVGFVLPAPS